MNTFMSNLERDTNYKRTENGAVAHKSTLSAVYDMFAFGGAYRNRTDEDCIVLFKKALDENPDFAMKCLFYLRDIRGGQGERRFFRVCFDWLCNNHPSIAKPNLVNVSEYGRWDDLIYATYHTYVWLDALAIIKHQLAIDVECKTPSLLAKWLPSENASSATTKEVASAIRVYLGMTHKQYRKMLSALRTRINIVEKLMSEGRWDEIEFDKIPSRAGLIYRNAFARRDIIAKKYESFVKDETKTVNAKDLYPYDIVGQITPHCGWRGLSSMSDVERAALQKSWNNLPDYFEGTEQSMIAVVDTSGSMTWGIGQVKPIDVAVSLGLYCAERNKGAFANKYISFSSRPQLIDTTGVDLADKVQRIIKTNLCENTNLEATFALLKRAALHSNPEDIPSTVVIISDMEIDEGRGYSRWCKDDNDDVKTLMEQIREDWNRSGLEMPKLVYWNVNARNDTVLDLGPYTTYASGASPVTFQMVMTGKTGIDLMLDKLNSKRYENVVA